MLNCAAVGQMSTHQTAPGIFQQVINNLFSDLDFVQACLDDILITSSDSFQDDLEKLDIVPQ